MDDRIDVLTDDNKTTPVPGARFVLWKPYRDSKTKTRPGPLIVLDADGKRIRSPVFPARNVADVVLHGEAEAVGMNHPLMRPIVDEEYLL